MPASSASAAKEQGREEMGLLLPVMVLTASCAFGVASGGSYGFLVKLSPNDFNDNSGGAVVGVMNFDGAGGISGPYTIQIGTNGGGQTSQAVSGT